MQETKADRKAKEKARKAEQKAAAREERNAVLATMTEEQKQAHREEQMVRTTNCVTASVVWIQSSLQARGPSSLLHALW